MKLVNFEVQPFYNFLLNDFKLIGKLSRQRSKFLKILEERIKEIEEDRISLIHEYAKKNEDGLTSQTEIDENGNEKFVMDDMISFDKEYKILQSEELIISRTPENDSMLNAIYDMVLDSQKEYGGQEALVYDRWCEIVESE